MENHLINQSLPKKTLMRKSLTMHNPPVIKSSDGHVYRQTGKSVSAPYVKPKGKVYVVPPKSAGLKSEYDVLKPFESVIDKGLAKKGLKGATTLEDKAKLFYNHIIAAKGFNRNKPVNFEAIDDADSTVPNTIVPELLTYMKSLVAGVQPDGTPLATQDQKLSNDAKAIVQNLAAKVANAGLSPQDAASAGAHLSNVPPVSTPFYKQPYFKWIVGVVIVVIVIKFVF